MIFKKKEKEPKPKKEKRVPVMKVGTHKKTVIALWLVLIASVSFGVYKNFTANNKIVILSTHIVADVEYIADEIIVLKKGMILNKGTTDILLKEIQNHVWECFVNMDQINLFEDKFIVSNRKYTENGAVLRIVSTNQPALNAKKVEPSLEDLYLYYFREEGEN